MASYLLRSMAAKIPLEKGETDDATAMSYGFIPGVSRWSPFHGSAGAAGENPALFFCSGKRGWKFVRWTALRPLSYKSYDKAY